MDKVKKIFFEGSIEASKSLMNRALIVQSFYSGLEIIGKSNSEDVKALQACLAQLRSGERQFDCGAGGTTFRFLLARLSREEGEFVITGTDRLFERPHDELYEALVSLGCHLERMSSNEIKLVSKGWRVGPPLKLSLAKSSQFTSALLLSSWNLDRPLTLELDREVQKGSYLWMTIELVKLLGMNIEVNGVLLTVLQEQECAEKFYDVEPDMSSAFAVAAFGLYSGEVKISGFPKSSLQPDFEFLKLITSMGGQSVVKNGVCQIKSGADYKPIEISLKKSPDLFPVLTVLLSRVEGKSTLKDLDVLKFKESDRLAKTKELLRKLEIEFEEGENSLSVIGKKGHAYPARFEFDPDHDHRMAMAAALANHQGASIEISNKNVVNKSFPGFWEVVGQ